jgi:iron-sulfur cluster assembly protein
MQSPRSGRDTKAVDGRGIIYNRKEGDTPLSRECSSTFKNRKGEVMITLTPAAVSKVKTILAERKEEAGLRIAVIGGGCSGFQYQMTLDREPRADDQVMDMDGLRVFVDTRSLLYLNGTSVDYVDGANGSGFKFNNPNAKTSCGCGESFEA